MCMSIEEVHGLANNICSHAIRNIRMEQKEVIFRKHSLLLVNLNIA